jgi:putative ABC transport system substrate-binding protein
LLTLLSAAARVSEAGAQSSAETVRVTFVGSVSEATAPRAVAAFWTHLRQLGWVEGQNLIPKTYWADGRVERLPKLMADAVSQPVNVLVTFGTPAATAARKVSRTVPIVVMGMGDPVATGLVQSLARPGGNLTGLSAAWDQAFAGKWLELLRETTPRLATVAVLGHSDNPLSVKVLEAVRARAAERGLKVRFLGLKAAEDIGPAIDEARQRAQALLVLSDPVTFTARRQLIALAAKHRLPTVFPMREFVDDGGLMSYGSDSADLGRRSAEYVDRILRGAKPGDLPIEQPTRFVLVVNLRTSRNLELQIPESILLRADEVIR